VIEWGRERKQPLRKICGGATRSKNSLEEKKSCVSVSGAAQKGRKQRRNWKGRYVEFKRQLNEQQGSFKTGEEKRTKKTVEKVERTGGALACPHLKQVFLSPSKEEFGEKGF